MFRIPCYHLQWPATSTPSPAPLTTTILFHLQAALPFKTKPKLEGKRKRKSLEQKRAVVLEPEERKKVTLISQLNAIRNQKAVARREQRTRQKATQVKKAAAEEAWRKEYNK
jgi:ribosome biogenesis protein BMS1